jgi:hypothetical protein
MWMHVLPTMVMLYMQNAFVVQKIVKDICSNDTLVVHDGSTVQHNPINPIAMFIYSEAFFQMWTSDDWYE